ncbi:hypothetical protein Tco_0363101 [Tanacetum coccineum]
MQLRLLKMLIARLVHEKELAEMEREKERKEQRHDQASVDYIARLYDEVQARMTYQLNKKTFEEIKAFLYTSRNKIRDAAFVAYWVPEEPESTKVEVKQEGRGQEHQEKIDMEYLMTITECLELMEVQGYITNFTEYGFQDFIDWDSLKIHIHILALEDGTEIHMLAERRYPLIRETLERMMELRLTAESKGEAVFDLLRFIQKQIDEFGGQDRSEKDL